MAWAERSSSRSCLARVANALACLVLLMIAGCGGGGSSPTTPNTPPAGPPNLPSGSPCNILGGGVASATAIVNGHDCGAINSSVVLVNMRDAQGNPAGSCSGTIVSRRAVVTAAHCLDGDAASVRIFLGSGNELFAQSFAGHPGYNPNGDSSFDVAVVLMGEDFPRNPIPLLLSRDARVGETAVIAGWGRGLNIIGATLRAGVTTISAVSPTIVQTQFSETASAVCQGDSGGAILLQEGGVWSLAGVTSANSTTFCAFGPNFYASIREPSVTSFILARVPDAAQR